MNGEFTNEGGGFKIGQRRHATLKELQREVILERLEFFGGHHVKTAKSLGIGLRTLGMKVKEYRKEGRPCSPQGLKNRTSCCRGPHR